MAMLARWSASGGGEVSDHLWPATFDPTWPIETHIHADICDGEIAGPMIWTACVYERDREMGIWRCVLDNTTLAEWTKAARETMKLPISNLYRAIAKETLFQLEAAVLMRRTKRKPTKGDWEPWTPETFRQSVEAVCGEAKRLGSQYWFRCPWHDDAKPSFEVNFDTMIWHCWGECGIGGGYIEWEKRLGGKDARSTGRSSGAGGAAYQARE